MTSKFKIPLFYLFFVLLFFNLAGNVSSVFSQDEDAGVNQTAWNWFYSKRSFPFDTIPSGAFENAVNQKAALYQGAGFHVTANNWKQIGPLPYDVTGVGIYSGRIAHVVYDPRDPDEIGNYIYVTGAYGGVWKTTDAGTSWQNKSGDLPSLLAGAFTLDAARNILYFGSSGNFNTWVSAGNGMRIFMSTNDGNNWISISNGIDVGASINKIVVSPNDLTGNTLFAATSRGLFKTINRGGNWDKIIPDDGTSLICTDVCFSPAGTSVYAVGPSSGRSYPWNLIFDGIGYYRSDDGGATFSQITNAGFPHSNDLTATTLCAVSKAPGAEDLVWFLSYDETYPNTDYVYKSVDHGQSFSNRSVGSNFATKYHLSLRASDVDANVCYAGNMNLYRTTNGSLTEWDCIGGYCGKHGDVKAVDINPFFPNKITEGNDGGVFRLDDPQGSWINCNQNLGSLSLLWGLASSTYDANFVAGGLHDFSTFSFNSNAGPGNTNWNSASGGSGDCGNVLASPFKSKHFVSNILVGNQNIFYSLDGTNFGYSTGYAASSTYSVELGPFTQHPSMPGTVYTARFDGVWAGTQNVQFRKSTDYGVSWGTDNEPFRELQRPSVLNYTAPTFTAISQSNPNTMIMAFTNGNEFWQSQFNAKSGLIKSLDGGNTWEGVDYNPPIVIGGSNGTPNRSFTDIEIDPKNENIVYLTVSGFFYPNTNEGHVFRSTDGGYNWESINGNLPDVPVNDIMIHYTGTGSGDVELIIATDAGIYSAKVTNSNWTWAELAGDFPNTLALHLDYNRLSGKLRANTWGRGAWEIQLDGNEMAAGPVYVQDQLYITDNVTIGQQIIVDNGGKLILGHQNMNDPFTINFINNAKIVILNGGKIECPANYPITLQSNDGSWGGIEIQNGGYGNISNCIFNNTETPVTISASRSGGNDILVDHCTINGGSIVSTGRDNVYIMYNTINSPSSSGTAISFVWGSNDYIAKNNILNANVGISLSNNNAYVHVNNISHSGNNPVSTGISFDNSYAASVKRNTITDYPIGMYCYSSSPVLFENVITGVNQSSTGIQAFYNSSPRLRPSDDGDATIWDGGRNVLDLSNFSGSDCIQITSNSYPDLDFGCNTLNSTGFSLSGDLHMCMGLVEYLLARRNTWSSYSENVCDADYEAMPPGCQEGGSESSNDEQKSEPPLPFIFNYGHGLIDTVMVLNRNINISDDIKLFTEAKSFEYSGDYFNAVLKYKEVINNYRDSNTASGSLKRLIHCYEKMNASPQVFSDLRTYYRDLIQVNSSDTGFVNIAEELATKCLVMMGSPGDAIMEYENTAANSTDTLKILCAELNIIETYMIMQQGSNARFTGNMQELKPVSVIDGIRMINEKLHRLNEIKNNNQIPNKYSLSQNYPNPFNPVTTISYALPRKSNVNIKVFDLLGRLVKTLVNEYKDAGVYSVSFDGSSLASGVYFYRIEAGDFTDSKKMILVK